MPASSAIRASRRQSGQLPDHRSAILVAERPDEQLAPNRPIFSRLPLYIAARSLIDAIRDTAHASLMAQRRRAQSATLRQLKIILAQRRRAQSATLRQLKNHFGATSASTIRDASPTQNHFGAASASTIRDASPTRNHFGAAVPLVLRMILSEKSATFRDHALGSALVAQRLRVLAGCPGQVGGNAGNDVVPFARLGLAIKARRRVPDRGAPFEQPTPVRGEGQQYPHRFSERAGKMGDRGVDGNHKVEPRDQGGCIAKVRRGRGRVVESRVGRRAAPRHRDADPSEAASRSHRRRRAAAWSSKRWNDRDRFRFLDGPPTRSRSAAAATRRDGPPNQAAPRWAAGNTAPPREWCRAASRMPPADQGADNGNRSKAAFRPRSSAAPLRSANGQASATPPEPGG